MEDLKLKAYIGKEIRVYLNYHYFPHGDYSSIETDKLTTVQGQLLNYTNKYLVIEAMIVNWDNILFIETDMIKKH